VIDRQRTRIIARVCLLLALSVLVAIGIYIIHIGQQEANRHNYASYWMPASVLLISVPVLLFIYVIRTYVQKQGLDIGGGAARQLGDSAEEEGDGFRVGLGAGIFAARVAWPDIIVFIIWAILGAIGVYVSITSAPTAARMFSAVS